MTNISLYKYVAHNNPEEAHALLVSKGYYQLPKQKEAVTMGLADLVDKDKDEGLIEIAKIHPDKELFGMANKKGEISCNGCDGEWSNAEGDEEKKFSIGLSPNTTNILIVSSTVVLTFTALALILRKVK